MKGPVRSSTVKWETSENLNGVCLILFRLPTSLWGGLGASGRAVGELEEQQKWAEGSSSLWHSLLFPVRQAHFNFESIFSCLWVTCSFWILSSGILEEGAAMPGCLERATWWPGSPKGAHLTVLAGGPQMHSSCEVE